MMASNIPDSALSEVQLAEALARWVDTLAHLKRFKAQLLEPNPGDVSLQVLEIEETIRKATQLDPSQIRTANGGRSYLAQALRLILLEMIETTHQLEQISSTRAQVSEDILGLFRRADFPAGSVLDVKI